MKNLKIKKTKLLKIVEKNRAAHRDLFLKAQAGFRKRVIERLDQMLEDAKKGHVEQLHVGLQAPIDQTKDYDRVIAALQISTGDSIEITEAEFAQYVMDDWSWKGNVTTLNSSYTR